MAINPATTRPSFSQTTDPFSDNPEIPNSPEGKQEAIEWDCSMDSPPRNIQEDSFCTPQKRRKIGRFNHEIADSSRSPDANGQTLETPKKVRTAFKLIEDEGLAIFSPSKAGKKIVAEGLESVSQMPTPTRKRKAESLLQKVYTQLAPDLEPTSAEFHYKADETLRTESLSSTGKKIITSSSRMLGKSPTRVLPMKHLTQLDEKGRGYHLHLDDSIPIKEIARNPLNGVRFVCVDGKKLSTLFPEGTDEQNLIKIVDTAEKIIENGNRSLRSTSDGYVIECYTNTLTGRISYSSVFPLLFFTQFSPNQQFELTADFLLPSDRMLKDARSIDIGGKGNSPKAKIQYTSYDANGELDRVFVDLAPLYEQQTGVDRGIIVQFNRENAEELFEFYRKKTPEIFYMQTNLDESF